jgi:hypothetical protein
MLKEFNISVHKDALDKHIQSTIVILQFILNETKCYKNRNAEREPTS